MIADLWLDGILLLVAIVVGLWLYRLGSGQSSAALRGGDDQPASERGWGYYPRLARQAGFSPAGLFMLFWVGKIAFAFLLPLVLLELTFLPAVPFWFLLGLSLVGFFVPDVLLVVARRKRRRRIAGSLSYFLDLLVSLLNSGLGLDQAFARAGREGFRPGHPLAEEVDLVAREIDVGGDRAEAFAALADRTGVREMRGVTSALRMGARLGTPMEATLRAQADLLRARHQEQAMREISTATTKALLPVLLCGFPLFLVIVLFPTLLEVAQTLRALAASLF